MMRLSQPVRMADDADRTPVWARSRKRSSGNPLVNVVVTLLALFGALTAVLGVKERSLAEGGAIVDGWIAAGADAVRGLAGQGAEKAGVAAEKAASEAEQAAARTGEALKSGADKASQDLKQR